MAAHQAPPSLGFSRQEDWSGLPFPSSMHESEKWKGSRSVVSDSLRPHGLQPTRLLRPWDFWGKSTGVGCHCLLQEYWSGLLFPSPMHACILRRFSLVQVCVTLWSAAHQAPLSTRFSRQEYWSGLTFPSPHYLCRLFHSAWCFWDSHLLFCVSV